MKRKKYFWLTYLTVTFLTLTGCFSRVSPPQAYTLAMQVEGQGTVTPETGTYQYTKSTAVNLTATPHDDWFFSHWEGPVADRYALSTTAYIDKEVNISAIFKQNNLIISQAPGGLITRRLDNSRPELRSIEDIEYIVIHAMSDAQANPRDPFQIERIRYIFDTYGVEANYVIDRDGTVYQFLEDHLIARHAGTGSWGNIRNTMNRYSIGIELLGIGTKQEMEGVITAESNAQISHWDRGYTDKQYHALQQLVRNLMYQYKIPSPNVIGHDDYDPGRKWDPGELFHWTRVTKFHSRP